MRVVLLFLLLFACGRDATAPAGESLPPPAPGAPARLEDYFTQLELLDASTGLPGLYDDSKGYRFSRKIVIELSATAKREAMIRLVVRSRTTGEGRLGMARMVRPGTSRISLARFPGDLYDLELSVGQTLLTTIPFAAE